MKKRLSAIVLLSALLMLILRILTPGWFLIFLFGPIDLFVTAAQIFIGLLFIKRFKFASLYSVESVILCLCILFYTAFFLLQVDFGDTPDSARVVLQHLTGKNQLTQYCIGNWFSCVAPMGTGLLLTYVGMIVRLVSIKK